MNRRKEDAKKKEDSHGLMAGQHGSTRSNLTLGAQNHLRGVKRKERIKRKEKKSQMGLTH
jgi:hypothetical protein